jgi:hypothetical protein
MVQLLAYECILGNYKGDTKNINFQEKEIKAFLGYNGPFK